MSINIPTHFVQQYSTNVALLLQQKGSKLRGAVSEGQHFGKQASPVDQIGKVEMQPVTSRFAPMGRVDATMDRRWVSPSKFDLPQMIDSFDKLRLITDPTSAYVQNAVMAAGRQIDILIAAAFGGIAKTGETGEKSTSATAGNEVDVAVGGPNSKLNVAKIKALKTLMMRKFIDFDNEEVFIGITALDHESLLNEIQVISTDFNARPVLMDGKVTEFLGFKFIHCELLETALAGTNEVTLPVWCKSGMHLGIWDDIRSSISVRHDIQGEPFQLYTQLTAGATRIEEDKVFAIESYRA